MPYYIYRKTHKGKDPTPAERRKLEKQGKALFEALVSLGPSFIKLGQLLSVRPDILPQEYLKELEKLQDEVPSAPFEQVESLIRSELGSIEKVFEKFEKEPIASASLGQVYKAIYRGMQVAVKVNRPNIKKVVEEDLAVLGALLKIFGFFLDKNLSKSLEAVVEEYKAHVFDEMDYVKEARNMELIANELKGSGVIVPRVFKEVSTKSVLVMSFHEGTKITRVEELKALGVDTAKLARKLARTFLLMVLEKPIFHADPHPGNISVTEKGEIILYDYGMVGSLNEYTKKHLIRLYASFSLNDPKRIVDEMLELGLLDPSANRYVIEQGVELTLREFRGEKISEWEFQRVMELANRLIYKFPFRLPAELVMYLRMASTLEEVCKKLDPQFNFLKLLTNLLEERGYLDELRREDMESFIKSIFEAGGSLLRLTPLLLRRLEREEFDGKRPVSRAHIWPSLALFAIALYASYEHAPYSFLVMVVAFVVLLIGEFRK